MRQVGVLATLLVVAMVGSYLTWTRPVEGGADDDERVAVYRATEDDLLGLSWQAPDLEVTVEKKTDARGAYTWVTVKETKQAAKPPPKPDETEGAPEEAEGTEPSETPEGGTTETSEGSSTETPPLAETPPPEVTTTAFAGGDKTTELWQGFAPLMALRELQPTGTEMDFGYEGEKAAKLAVQRKDGALDLQVGGEAYGSRDRFVSSEGRHYLVDDATLRLLEHAKLRLVERRLHPFDEADIDAVEVLQGPASAAFVQRNKDDRAAAFWAKDGSAEKDEAASTWLGKLFRIKVQEYVDEASVPNAVPALEFAVQKGKERWSVAVFSADVDGRTEYYAKSEFARGLVQLQRSTASDAVEDLDAVFAESGDAEPSP